MKIFWFFSLPIITVGFLAFIAIKIIIKQTKICHVHVHRIFFCVNKNHWCVSQYVSQQWLTAVDDFACTNNSQWINIVINLLMVRCKSKMDIQTSTIHGDAIIHRQIQAYAFLPPSKIKHKTNANQRATSVYFHFS